MRGTIGVPRGHFSAPWPFIESMTTLLQVTEQDFIVKYREGALISDNRNSLVALREGEYLLFIDDDMMFTSEDVDKLVAHIEDGKDIVTGLYFRGGEYNEPCMSLKEYPESGLIEIDWCGMGFVIIASHVLEELEDPFDRIGKQGEDVSFCKRAKEKGFKIWCDTSIRLGHIRYSVVLEENYNKYKEVFK